MCILPCRKSTNKLEMATDSEELSDVDESEEVSEEVSEQVSDEGSGSEDMSDLQEMDHPYLVSFGPTRGKISLPPRSRDINCKKTTHSCCC